MRPPHKQVSVIGVQLYVDEEENELKLFDKKSKKQVQVFDLGFQGIKGRSNLYQLLEKFTPIQNYNVSEILNRINKVFQKDTNNYTYEIKPRIIYERNIIIQRKSWILTKDSLPFRNTIDSKEDYFAKVLSWKEKLNLPDEVFVYIIERSELRNLNKNENLILKHDDHKPQYISFHNPILIDLFSKIIKRVPNNLLIEEMLPSSNQLMKINKKEYVSEILYQWHERI